MIMAQTIQVTAKWFSKENHFAVIIYAAIVYIYCYDDRPHSFA